MEGWLMRMMPKECRLIRNEEADIMWNTAVTAMISLSAFGFFIADGEMRRVRWIQAMRRCLWRMNNMIRYERPTLVQMLVRIELYATPQERALTQLLHGCGKRLESSANPQLLKLFCGEANWMVGYGVLSDEDRSAFEGVLAELGRTGLDEQLKLIDEADERLRRHEERLRQEVQKRAQLIRTLGITGGAAVFLMLI